MATINAINIATGAVGTVLTGNGVGSAPTFQAAGGGGVTSLSGTANQITASASTGAVTLSTPSTFIAPGSIESTTSITAGTDVVTVAGSFFLPAVTGAADGTIFTESTGRMLWMYPGIASTPSLYIGLAGNIGTVFGDAHSNVAIGEGALGNIAHSSKNIAIGFSALSTVTAVGGTFNVAIGHNAGSSSGSSSASNIYLNSVGANESNTLRIGSGNGTSDGQLATAFIQGISGVTVTGSAVLISTAGQLGTIVSSLRFKENIKPMGSMSDGIYKLNPVLFTFKKSPEMGDQPGLIAEEVAQVMPNLVINDEEGPFSVKYHELPVLLLNEIKKLNERIKILENRNVNANSP